jgi:hypothetical protein
MYLIILFRPFHSQYSVFSSYIFESTTIIDREYIPIKIAVDYGSKDKRIILFPRSQRGFIRVLYLQEYDHQKKMDEYRKIARENCTVQEN